MPAERPILLRLLPSRLRNSLYSRYYAKRHADFRGLFERAELSEAPGVSMVGLVPGDTISGHIAFRGAYDDDLTSTISRLADRGGLFVDVGANMGYFSLIWASKKPGNRAIAFEASPRISPLLNRNLRENGLEGRVQVREQAASDTAGKLNFDVGPDDQTGWGGIAESGGIEVEAVRLDDVIDEPVDLVKIDTEGADFLVLRGMERLLREKKVGRIFYELNPTRMQELGLAEDDIPAFLEGCGYKTTPTSSDRTCWQAVPA